MNLPSLTDPEGLFDYVIGIIMVLAAVFGLFLLLAGVWQVF